MGGLGLPLSTVAAQTYNSQITVTAQVLPGRYIYLNESGVITKLAGNTSDNIAPAVIDSQNHKIAATDEVLATYQQVLDSHQGHLEAGRIYIISPAPKKTEVKLQIDINNITPNLPDFA